MKKIVYINSIFENVWWEDAYPSSYPVDPSLAIIYGNHQKSQVYFSHLSPLILFFFTKRQSQKGGGGRAWPNAPPPQIHSCCENIFESSIVTALTACPFLIKKFAKMSVFLVKTVTIRWRLDAKPPAANEYLRFFNKKTCRLIFRSFY